MGKKFTIVKIDDTNISQQPPLANSKFKTFISTRPKKCPLCNTENKITKENSVWKCKKCEHTWT